MKNKEKNDILLIKQILTTWQLNEYVSEEVIDKIEGVLQYTEQLESDKQDLIKN